MTQQLSSTFLPNSRRYGRSAFTPSGIFVEFPKEEIEQSIPHRFEKIVRTYPARIAVKCGDRTLTYEELNQAANRMAHAILAQTW